MKRDDIDEKNEYLLVKVLEAYPQDVTRVVVRIHKDASEMLKLRTGDIAEIKGKRRTVAKYLPLDPSDGSDKKSVRMDGLLRNNLGVAIGDTISIRKIKAAVAAKKVVVAPLEAIPPIDERYLADALDGVPLIKEDNVMVPYFGGRLTFQVIGATPTATEDAVIVTEKTIFHVAKVTEKSPSYDEKISMIVNKIIQMDSQDHEEFESMMNLIRRTYEEFKREQTKDAERFSR